MIKSFHELGGEKVRHPGKTSFVFDHYSPAPTIKAADNHKKMREFCAGQGIPHLFDIGEGVCHQVLTESGMVGPGTIVVETDSHTTTMGALGAFGTGVGATDMATILITGKLWFKVPRVMNIVFEGTPPKGVMAKDMILHAIGDLKQDAAIYKAVEFSGGTVREMAQEERFVLCNGVGWGPRRPTSPRTASPSTISPAMAGRAERFPRPTRGTSMTPWSGTTYPPCPPGWPCRGAWTPSPPFRGRGSPWTRYFLAPAPADGSTTSGRGGDPGRETGRPGNPVRGHSRLETDLPGRPSGRVHRNAGERRRRAVHSRLRSLSRRPRGHPGTGRNLRHHVEPEFPRKNGKHRGGHLYRVARHRCRHRAHGPPLRRGLALREELGNGHHQGKYFHLRQQHRYRPDLSRTIPRAHRARRNRRPRHGRGGPVLCIGNETGRHYRCWNQLRLRLQPGARRHHPEKLGGGGRGGQVLRQDFFPECSEPRAGRSEIPDWETGLRTATKGARFSSGARFPPRR